ncbi:hypothetical protein [Maribacter halichondriae]|uniref:hypothetical protein n=1 Tax=Maribacter halichondriae TaxID=2980554 RepID=UPI002359E1E9|nr:hypothetical protein [Maribacter sp. Hal144]
MKNDYQSADFKKLLDKLQQDSWQLELIISGFAIYGLFVGFEPIEVESLKAVKNNEALGSFFISNTLNSMSILIMLLLTHVVLRGLWIGAIGLRYVSGEIEYKKLNYSEKFTSFLEKKVGSFDQYISRLENICSSLFALAFLMIFFFISSFMVVGVFTLVTHYLEGLESISKGVHTLASWTFNIVYFFCVLLVLIDFLGAGLLKRNKLISKIYFPIYRVFSYITLSFLYRPLVYNFLDQKKARWLGILIVPLYLLFSIFASAYGRSNSNYLVVDQNTSGIYTNKENYEDQLIEETELVRFVSIPSKVIEKPYLPIFIGFNAWMEDAVFENDSTLLPKNDERGYGFRLDRLIAAMGRSSINITSAESLGFQKRYLENFGKIFQFHIDSMVYKSEFGMTANKKDRFGFETYLDIENLPKGKHLLRFIGPDRQPNGEFVTDTLITIPFWYFPENSSGNTKSEIPSSEGVVEQKPSL